MNKIPKRGDLALIIIASPRRNRIARLRSALPFSIERNRRAINPPSYRVSNVLAVITGGIVDIGASDLPALSVLDRVKVDPSVLAQEEGIGMVSLPAQAEKLNSVEKSRAIRFLGCIIKVLFGSNEVQKAPRQS